MVQFHAADCCFLLFFGSPRHSWTLALLTWAGLQPLQVQMPPSPQLPMPLKGCLLGALGPGYHAQQALASPGVSNGHQGFVTPTEKADFPHLQDLQLRSEGKETALFLGNATFHMQSSQPRNVKRLLPSTVTAPLAVTDISSSPTTNTLFCQYFSPEFTRNVELKQAIGF